MTPDDHYLVVSRHKASGIGSVIPRRDTRVVVESQAVLFAEVARTVASQARSLGLKTPVYKSPPRIVGVSRTLRRRADGQAVVSVAFRSRPWPAVVADMIEGVLVINDLTGAAACRVRDDMWEPFAKEFHAAA